MRQEKALPSHIAQAVPPLFLWQEAF